MRQGPFPPPALPDFVGITSPSAICPSRLRPSRASRCRRLALRLAPRQTSLVAHQSSRARAVTTTPAERSGAFLARLPDHGGLPQTLWRVGFRGNLFGACTVFTLVTARTLRFPPYKGSFLRCFRPFVASWPAPSASGRSESGRVGISPTGLVHLSQGTHNALAESKNGSVVRKIFGYGHIPSRFAQQIHLFNQEILNPYVNYHRPCFFPETHTDAQGRQRKRYRYETMMTPYEKLKSLPGAETYLKPGLSFAILDQVAYAISDNQAADRLQKARHKLFHTIREQDLKSG